MSVFVLHHVAEQLGQEDVRFIGVYATRLEAESAIERLRAQPGFHLWPEGFVLAEQLLGLDRYAEGFSVRRSICVPLLEPSGGEVATWRLAEAECLPGERYRILAILDGSPADRLAFEVGEVVRCEPCEIDGLDWPMARARG